MPRLPLVLYVSIRIGCFPYLPNSPTAFREKKNGFVFLWEEDWVSGNIKRIVGSNYTLMSVR